ncbi:MAG: hypothetical protein R2828_12585 [Saprospiraceae bacterium]
MKNHFRSLLFLLLLISSSCELSKNIPPASYASPNPTEPSYLTKSLFNFADRTLSEEDIAQILNSEIKLPDTIRLAILNYSDNTSNRYYYNYWNNEEYLKLQQAYIDVFKTTLSANSQVKKIILMPKLMIGTSPNIFTLRESAVRLQANLFLVFSIHSDIYYQYKVFKKNEAKAFATVEALLMDVKTGIIPYSEIITRDNQVTRTEADLNDQDTQKRAENGAIYKTLEELSARLNAYLKY